MVRRIFLVLAALQASVSLAAPIRLAFEGRVTTGSWEGAPLHGSVTFDPDTAGLAGGDGSNTLFHITNRPEMEGVWGPTWMHVEVRFADRRFSTLEEVPSGLVPGDNAAVAEVLLDYSGQDLFFPIRVTQSIFGTTGQLEAFRQAIWFAQSYSDVGPGGANNLVERLSYVAPIDVARAQVQSGRLRSFDGEAAGGYDVEFVVNRIRQVEVDGPASVAMFLFPALVVAVRRRRHAWSRR